MSHSLVIWTTFVYLFRRDGDSQEFKFLHLRELELLAFIRVKDLGLYEECKQIFRARKDNQVNSEPYNL